ncbi:hypothetical protein C1S79_12350 [Mycolicibacterium phocaicum]|uniref:Uncharacterized protein n=1 Tax=Mycolicibacterium phocaicum TaxID=319706 RepID=A0AA94UFD1_9MYCO|nr:hypothetical protein C1S79_12350 [Mycolicibacterium phocaicum]
MIRLVATEQPRDDYDRGIPDYRRLASQIGHILAANGPNIIAPNGRAFWKLTDANSGVLAWLAFTRPNGSALARRKVWTLIPRLQVFIANWFVSVDHQLTDQVRWVHTNIDIYEARELALLVPEPSTDDLKRITRPEAVLTLDDVDRHKVVTVLGKGTDHALKGRR